MFVFQIPGQFWEVLLKSARTEGAQGVIIRPIFCPKQWFFDRSRRRTSKNTVFTAREWTSHAPARNRQEKSEKDLCFFDFWSSIFGFEMRIFSMCLVGRPGARFCDFGGVWVTVFAVFVAQKH